jgi:hypothetical protein
MIDGHKGFSAENVTGFRGTAVVGDVNSYAKSKAAAGFQRFQANQAMEHDQYSYLRHQEMIQQPPAGYQQQYYYPYPPTGYAGPGYGYQQQSGYPQQAGYPQQTEYPAQRYGGEQGYPQWSYNQQGYYHHDEPKTNDEQGG